MRMRASKRFIYVETYSPISMGRAYINTNMDRSIVLCNYMCVCCICQVYPKGGGGKMTLGILSGYLIFTMLPLPRYFKYRREKKRTVLLTVENTFQKISSLSSKIAQENKASQEHNSTMVRFSRFRSRKCILKIASGLEIY